MKRFNSICYHSLSTNLTPNLADIVRRSRHLTTVENILDGLSEHLQPHHRKVTSNSQGDNNEIFEFAELDQHVPQNDRDDDEKLWASLEFDQATQLFATANADAEKITKTIIQTDFPEMHQYMLDKKLYDEQNATLHEGVLFASQDISNLNDYDKTKCDLAAATTQVEDYVNLFEEAPSSVPKESKLPPNQVKIGEFMASPSKIGSETHNNSNNNNNNNDNNNNNNNDTNNNDDDNNDNDDFDDNKNSGFNNKFFNNILNN